MEAVGDVPVDVKDLHWCCSARARTLACLSTRFPHIPTRKYVCVGSASQRCAYRVPHPLGHGSRSTLQHINESGSLDEFDDYVGKKAYLEMDAVYVRGDGCLAAMHVSSVMVNDKELCLRKVPMSPRA